MPCGVPSQHFLSPLETWRLVIQSDWSIMLQINPGLKEPLLHLALCIFSDWLYTYYPIILPSFLSLHPPNISLNLCTFSHISKYFPFSSYHAILNKSHLYLTLRVWDMLASLCHCNGLYIQPFKIVKLLRLQRSSAPPLFHLCLNDRSGCLGYVSQDRWIHLPSQWSGSDSKCIRKHF